MVEWFSLALRNHQATHLEMILLEWKWNYYFIVEYNNYNYEWNNILYNWIIEL